MYRKWKQREREREKRPSQQNSITLRTFFIDFFNVLSNDFNGIEHRNNCNNSTPKIDQKKPFDQGREKYTSKTTFQTEIRTCRTCALCFHRPDNSRVQLEFTKELNQTVLMCFVCVCCVLINWMTPLELEMNRHFQWFDSCNSFRTNLSKHLHMNDKRFVIFKHNVIRKALALNFIDKGSIHLCRCWSDGSLNACTHIIPRRGESNSIVFPFGTDKQCAHK